MITHKLVRAVSPSALPNIVEGLVSTYGIYSSRYNVNSPLRVAHFLGQTGHESNGFRAIEENLNYSSDALRRTFPRHFTEATAPRFHRQPQLIANHVYANRMGNGAPESGDGWRFRGAGLIQLTGRDNHAAFARFKRMSIEEVASYIRTVNGAIEASYWYWAENNLNRWADADDILRLSRAINLGNPNSRATPHGMPDRTQRTDAAKRFMGIHS